MFLLNSRQGRFPATPRSSLREGVHPQGHPFSRSYGGNLPSSLGRVLSTTLRRLPLPTSGGLRYGHPTFIGNEAFLGSVGSAESVRVAPTLPPPLSSGGGFPYRPHRLEEGTHHVQSARSAYPPASPLCLQSGGAGIFTGCPSATPFGLALGPA